MGRNRSDVKERIQKTAGRLFYEQGFPNTGIAQIAAEANTNKVSFYNYFKSKDDLGRDYLQRWNRQLLRGAIRIMHKSKNPQHFISLWFGLLKRNALYQPEYNGCPIANYHSQLELSRKEERDYIHKMINRWLTLFSIYYKQERAAGKLFSSLSDSTLARISFSSHQGAMMAWKLTGDTKVFEDAIITLRRQLEK